MPITKSAKKALRNSDRKRIFNLRSKNNIIDSRRKLMKIVTAPEPKKDLITTSLGEFYSSLDKAVKTNYIHKNKANRLKSRMALRISKALGEYKPEYKELAQKRDRTKEKSETKPKTSEAKVKAETKKPATKKAKKD
jgi:small subunit ribosomal protein S20